MTRDDSGGVKPEDRPGLPLLGLMSKRGKRAEGSRTRSAERSEGILDAEHDSHACSLGREGVIVLPMDLYIGWRSDEDREGRIAPAEYNSAFPGKARAR